MPFPRSFFKNIGILVVTVCVIVLGYRVMRLFYPIDAGVYWRLFSLVYIIALLMVFWAWTQKKIRTHPALVKTGFVFVFAYFILEAAGTSLNILAGIQATPGWSNLDQTNLASFMTLTAVFGRSLCFVGNILFLVGLIMFGLSTLRRAGMEKVVSASCFAYFIILFIYTAGRFGGIEPVYQVIRPFYLFAPPLAILLIGLWLLSKEELNQ